MRKREFSIDVLHGPENFQPILCNMLSSWNGTEVLFV